MNSKDFTCNTCGDVADFSYRLCRLCANKKEAGLSVDDPAKLAALTEADFDDIDNLIPTPHGMIL